MSSAIFFDSGEESGTGVLSFMIYPNQCVSKQPEDYTVRLGAAGACSAAPESGLKMPRRKTSAKPAQSNSVWAERLRYFEARQDQIVQTVRQFVEIESPSDNKAAADKMGAFLARSFAAVGGRALVHRSEDFADSVQIDFPGRES